MLTFRDFNLLTKFTKQLCKNVITISDLNSQRDGAVLPVHMYLVVFMVSVMVLYHLYICI
jgi:hypothetical protein